MSETRQAPLKELLNAAEAFIVELQDENQKLRSFCDDLMETQRLEAEQMAAISEQMWSLEDALMRKDLEVEEISALLGAVRQRLEDTREKALNALKATAENQPRESIARLVFDVAVHPLDDQLDRRIAEYNAAIAKRNGKPGG